MDETVFFSVCIFFAVAMPAIGGVRRMNILRTRGVAWGDCFLQSFSHAGAVCAVVVAIEATVIAILFLLWR